MIPRGSLLDLFERSIRTLQRFKSRKAVGMRLVGRMWSVTYVLGRAKVVRTPVIVVRGINKGPQST